jgi:predicted peptidase
MNTRLACIAIVYMFCNLALFGCSTVSDNNQVVEQTSTVERSSEDIVSAARLKRDTYASEVMQTDRDYFVYLPKGYDSIPNKTWPLLMFLHGNGERGNAKEGLDFVLMQGPLYEAWIQKKRLTFYYYFSAITDVWL